MPDRDIMQPAKLKFRQADLPDIPMIMKIRLEVKENVLADPDQIPSRMVEDYLGPLGHGWVCEINGKIVGFSFAGTQDSSIWALFVLPGYQGIGVGKVLLKLAVDWLFNRGEQEIKLSTEANTRADQFYQSQGWKRGKMKDAVEVWYSLRRTSGA